MIWIYNLWVVILSIVLNHVRGGGGLIGIDFEQFMPGRNLYYVAPLMAVTSLLITPVWWWAIYFGVCYLIWAAPGWGRWQLLNRTPRPARAPKRWELWLEFVGDRFPLGQITDPTTHSQRNDYACLLIRDVILSLPLLYLSPWFALWAPLRLISYEIGHRIGGPSGGGIAPSELIFGGVIGLMEVGIFVAL